MEPKSLTYHYHTLSLSYQTNYFHPSMASSLLLSTPFLSPHQRNPKSPISKPSLSLSSTSISRKFALSEFNRTIHFTPKPPLSQRRRFIAGNSVGDSDDFLIGEDSATFELSKQKISSWVYFTLILGVVLFALNFLWIDNSTGFGKYFIDALESIFQSPEVIFMCCYQSMSNLLLRQCTTLTISVFNYLLLKTYNIFRKIWSK